MIPKECKRLAEVDFPIAVVSRHSAKEKSIRFGHPSTLHLWWARRPLGACRSMLMSLLLPDPCDPNCPNQFKQSARNILPRIQGTPGEKDIDLRAELLRFIGDFANWDNSSSPTFLEAASGLVRAAHGEEAPLVVDPFAGGGSIPLEALRLGCDTFASDLNPVACFILKTLLEDIPRHHKLADELANLSDEIKAASEQELAEFYPQDTDGSKPIAFIWARTVICDNCGAEIPLVRSWWLSSKANGKCALRYLIDKPKGETPQITLQVFEPKKDSDVQAGTTTRAKATCPCCNTTMSPERVRVQLAANKGGGDAIFDAKGRRVGGARMLAVVTLKDGQVGRKYRVSLDSDYRPVWKATERIEKVSRDIFPNGLRKIPDEPLPAIGTLGFRVQRYGLLRWGDLFTARQKLTLTSLLEILRSLEYASPEARDVAALALSRLTDIFNGLLLWSSSADQVVHLFGRQAIPMVWDFSEPSPLGQGAGDYTVTLRTMIRVIRDFPPSMPVGQVQIADATRYPLPHESASVWFTDPPYYDAIPYSDLSDFFFVWLKRALPDNPLLKDPTDPTNPLTPKVSEIVEDETKVFEGHPKDRRFFEERMAAAFSEGRHVLRTDGIDARQTGEHTRVQRRHS